MQMDPLMMPVLISALAHDFIFQEHNIAEEQFKAALFEHKIYEDEEVAMHMQTKQMELLSLSGGFNPMMMGGMPPGMGGPGGPPGGIGGPGGMDPYGGMGMPPGMPPPGSGFGGFGGSPAGL